MLLSKLDDVFIINEKMQQNAIVNCFKDSASRVMILELVFGD